MSMRELYWGEVTKAMLRKDSVLATDMIMAIMSCNVDKASELYMKAVSENDLS